MEEGKFVLGAGPEGYRHNAKLALELWVERVAPEAVSTRLAAWRSKSSCGAVACFGGHLATWPEFGELGGGIEPGGSPVLVVGGDADCEDGDNVAVDLFDVDWIFARRAWGGLPTVLFESEHRTPGDLSDHAVVVGRLRYIISGEATNG